MRLYRYLSDFKIKDKQVALAIGNFDGFHQGHRAVIEAMHKKAREQNLYSAVMIFEPQPLEFFGKAVPARLYSLRDKLRAFASCNVDFVFCIKFDRSVAELDAKSFVKVILHKKMNVKSVTVGSLFTFGCGGVAGLQELKSYCSEVGIEADAILGVASDNTRISSTMIRALIAQSDFATAKEMLGRHYAISGRVVHGNAIGRTIGFPTANVNLNRQVCPLKGVFAVMVKTVYGQYKGMANIGLRPTIYEHKIKSILEVNIFDFNKDLYGTHIEVIFIKKVRDEQKFPDLTSLMAQIKADQRSVSYMLENCKL